jgi:hypothetical protein
MEMIMEDQAEKLREIMRQKPELLVSEKPED